PRALHHRVTPRSLALRRTAEHYRQGVLSASGTPRARWVRWGRSDMSVPRGHTPGRVALLRRPERWASHPGRGTAPGRRRCSSGCARLTRDEPLRSPRRIATDDGPHLVGCARPAEPAVGRLGVRRYAEPGVAQRVDEVAEEAAGGQRLGRAVEQPCDRFAPQG